MTVRLILEEPQLKRILGPRAGRVVVGRGIQRYEVDVGAEWARQLGQLNRVAVSKTLRLGERRF